MTSEIKSRVAALNILKKVLDEGATLDGAINKFSNTFSARDRGFVRHITATTIRRLGQLDKIINHCTKKKLGNTQMQIRHVLRLGIAQLLYSEVPAYAAVNSSVELVDKCVSKKLHYLKNTVNALLRRVDQDREMLLKKFGNTRLNFPDWILKSWDERYGTEAVKYILGAVLSEAPLDISLKPDCDKNLWAVQLSGKVVPGGSIRINKAGKITELPGYNEGHWWVQDMAARIPETLLGAKEADDVLDLCAAPGGKTAQSAARGAKVTAVDFSESRLERLKENIGRLNLEVDVVTSDVLAFKPLKKFDFILLDAPCSSTGTIRRHPEILHIRKQEDVSELAKLQTKMLDHAVTLLNTGGIMIYSVCSMEKQEGPDQIKALLQRNSSLKRKEIKAEELPGLEQAILETGDVQTLPHYYEGGMDGFFISRLIKM
ncbi:MAG: 16S rRNA (cytosine(967)-C(5))-methyltransferase RsmB [Alphaproteobacteria bacterium]|nr:16S rRNA (cytosine(967)-C(5))-methyltransferase RsmB [Alphaproteobacteria bacterium]HPF45651.1 16S rRNA (cytosine(967)-C(5))-methyltransferase RsmB [Emcibacteraceae bacterium]